MGDRFGPEAMAAAVAEAGLTIDALWRLAMRDGKLNRWDMEQVRQRYRELLENHGLLRHQHPYVGEDHNASVREEAEG